MKKIILSLFLTSCVSGFSPDVIKSDTKDIYTLRLFTGKNGKDLYEEKFWQKAESLCPEGFEIKEATTAPSTLRKSFHSDYYYNWVIDCSYKTSILEFNDGE